MSSLIPLYYAGIISPGLLCIGFFKDSSKNNPQITNISHFYYDPLSRSSRKRGSNLAKEKNKSQLKYIFRDNQLIFLNNNSMS